MNPYVYYVQNTATESPASGEYECGLRANREYYRLCAESPRLSGVLVVRSRRRKNASGEFVGWQSPR
jgi:hypothetical protein